MKEIFNRLYGRSANSEPKVAFEGLLILSSDIRRLNELKLEELNPKFANEVRTAVDYLSELFSVTPENLDISLFDSKIETIVGRTSRPGIKQLELYDLIYPVYSALRNHHL